LPVTNILFETLSYAMPFITSTVWVFDSFFSKPLKSIQYKTFPDWGEITAILFVNQTFGIRKKLQVFDRKTPIKRINELEFIDGNIYANVWLTNKVAVISPQSGKVLYWVNFRGLLKKVAIPGKLTTA